MINIFKTISTIIIFMFFINKNSFAYKHELEFSLLTYNVAGLPDFISGSHPAMYTKLISPKLNDFDIVLVQEDFHYHDDLISLVTHPHISIKKSGFLNFGDGLNRLSRFRFTNFKRVTWNDCNGFLGAGNDCMTAKGFSMARHEIADGIFIDIYNWHADAGVKKKDFKARRKNILQLANAINTYSKNSAVIVAGDSNSRYTRSDDSINALIERAQLQDAWCALGAGYDESIDKILYRSSAQIKIIATKYKMEKEKFKDIEGNDLSDHIAISTTFKIYF